MRALSAVKPHGANCKGDASHNGWWRVILSLAILSLTSLAWGAVRTGEPDDAEFVTFSQPSDAPHVRDPSLRLPPSPAGYHRHDGGWVRFEFPPDMRQRIQPLITEANGYRDELVRRVGFPVLERVEVRIARSHREMAMLAPENAPFPGYASGVAYGQLGLILLSIEPRYPNSHHDLGEILRHELAHIAIHDATGGRGVPKWFNEGFAVHMSGESPVTRLQTLWSATLSNSLVPLDELERSFPSDPGRTDVAYAQAADVVRFLVRRQDHDRFGALFSRIRGGQPFALAAADAYGVDVETLESQWREDVAKRYTFWPVLFSSTVIWTGAIGLFVWGWRRRKRRDRLTLARWAREEAAEDAKKARERAEAESREVEPPRVHVVLARARMPTPMPSSPGEDIPKVQHDGSWHTLH